MLDERRRGLSATAGLAAAAALLLMLRVFVSLGREGAVLLPSSTKLIAAHSTSSSEVISDASGNRDADTGVISTPRYLVQLTNEYGRYSNMRIALSKVATLAAALQRTLVYARWGECPDPVEGALDVGQLGAAAGLRVVPFGPRGSLSALCPDDSVLLVFRGVGLNKGPSVADAAARGRWSYAGVVWRLALTTRDELTAASLAEPALAAAPCIAIFTGFELAVDEQARTMIVNTLEPTAAVRHAAAAFLANVSARIGGPEVVGVHMRLTDIGGGPGRVHPACRVNTTLLWEIARSISAAHRRATWLLATDDESNACARAFAADFNATHVESGVWKGGSCTESAFTQEVLGYTAAFIGSAQSTFSRAVEEIRTHRQRAPGVFTTP